MDGSILKMRLIDDPDLIVLLPHEYSEVQDRFKSLLSMNSELADEMTEAVGPSDWHDNPAYEAVMAEMEKLDMVSRALGPMATTGIVIPYPLFEEEVTIGSRATICTNGDEYMIDVVGQNAFVNRGLLQADDVETVSVRSPIGFAVLGIRPGENFTFELADGRIHSGQVNSVDQTAISSQVGEQCPGMNLHD